jgi:hypothetical protein
VQSANGRWILTNSSEPVVTRDETANPASLKTAGSTPLGKATFDLVSVSPSFNVESHKGHQMDARGLLYRDASYSELNLTSLTMIAPRCGN